MYPYMQTYGQTTTSAQDMLNKAVSKRAAAIKTNPESFRIGVQSATAWAEPTIAAGGVWRANLTQAMNTGSWENGIQKTGTAGWKQAAVEKAANWQTGSLAPTSQQKYATNFAPILNTIASTLPTLAPRGPANSPQNYQRVQQLGSAVHNASLSMKGGAPAYTPAPAPVYTPAPAPVAPMTFPTAPSPMPGPAPVTMPAPEATAAGYYYPYKQTYGPYYR